RGQKHRRSKAIDGSDPSAARFDGRRRANSSKGRYSTWRKNFPADFLQMQEAEIALCHSWLKATHSSGSSTTRKNPFRVNSEASTVSTALRATSHRASATMLTAPSTIAI